VNTFRRLTTSLLAVSTVAIALTGCGRTAPMNVAGATMRTAGLPAAMVAGKARKFGYNVTRYKRVLKAKQHPQRLLSRGPLAETVDNRKFCPPIYDQGDLGSCTAFSMGKGLREYNQRKNGEEQVGLSALWLYYNERAHMGNEYINEDSGANMIDGMWVLENKGNATDTSWPYLTPKFAVKPPAEADASAAAWKTKVNTNLATFDDVKTAINNGQAVAFGFMVYSSFQWIGKSGVMPMPKPNEQVLGGHAVLAVGYDDAKKLLTVRNSWGKGWGDNGYFYMPYDFAKDGDKTMDFWTAD
jgi:C1A family cysteine protease